ncbi:chorismate mutase [Bradyrhizobium sp. BR 10261]|uniref:chorismate mutase n=1 Tax=Bradyrhizobium sp. BR 10261 TaxID=2749992 RepID=UPI001C648677|nr:chorismate mutase [Bradyrhizobium sp. BR 10261]MBW7967150.1 chorismate mutase [Bradyrhizobium sp. BR 10261]
MEEEATTCGLLDLRDRIDRIDQDVVRLLASRAEVVRQVGELKKRLGAPVMQPDRVQIVLDSRAAQGAALGLRGEVVRKIWEVLVEEACRVEEEIGARPT